MKIFKILLVLVILSFLSATCSENSPTQTNPDSYGDVILSFEKATVPANVVYIKATLTRVDFEPISGILNLINSNTAEIIMNEIPAGAWHLRVEALDSSNTLLYEGDSDVNIISDQMVQVNLTLTPVSNGTGSIKIVVTWVDNNSHWIDYESNPILQSQSSIYDPLGVGQPFVIKVADTYYMYYHGLTYSGKFVIFLATSNDGISWTRYGTQPILLPGESGSWDDWSVAGPVVIKEENNYKLYYSGWRDSYDKWWIGMATSSDGMNWVKYPFPLIEGNFNSGDFKITATDIIKIDSTYYLYYTGKNSIYDYKIGLATSSDGIIWQKRQNPILDVTENWEGNAILYANIINEDNHYTMVYCNNNSSEITAFGLANSNDGIHWVKDSSNPIFTESMTVNNYLHISYPYIFKTENEYWIYYTGWVGDLMSINLIRNDIN